MSAHACACEDIAPQDTVRALYHRPRSANLWLEDSCLTEAGGDFLRTLFRSTETEQSRIYKRSGPNGLARRASAANATAESGVEAETRSREAGLTDGREGEQLAKPERASHSGDARFEGLTIWSEGARSARAEDGAVQISA